LSDPDHLKAFEIDVLYNHWLQRQAKGLTPLVILNSSPQHTVSKKLSEKARGKRKIGYVDVNSDDDDVEDKGERSGGDGEKLVDDEAAEKSPAPKIGPPRAKRQKTSIQAAEPSKIPPLEGKKKTKGPKPSNVPTEVNI
jgi:hypothetical protein